MFTRCIATKKKRRSCTLRFVYFIAHSNDDRERGAPPAPGAVGDDVGRVGDEWSVVCVELARLVRRTVVVRITDR